MKKEQERAADKLCFIDLCFEHHPSDLLSTILGRLIGLGSRLKTKGRYK